MVSLLWSDDVGTQEISQAFFTVGLLMENIKLKSFWELKCSFKAMSVQKSDSVLKQYL